MSATSVTRHPFDLVTMTNTLLAGPTGVPRPQQATQRAYRRACADVEAELLRTGYALPTHVVQSLVRKAIAGYLLQRLAEPEPMELSR